MYFSFNPSWKSKTANAMQTAFTGQICTGTRSVACNAGTNAANSVACNAGSNVASCVVCSVESQSAHPKCNSCSKQHTRSSTSSLNTRVMRCSWLITCSRKIMFCFHSKNNDRRNNKARITSTVQEAKYKNSFLSLSSVADTKEVVNIQISAMWLSRYAAQNYILQWNVDEPQQSPPTHTQSKNKEI